MSKIQYQVGDRVKINAEQTYNSQYFIDNSEPNGAPIRPAPVASVGQAVKGEILVLIGEINAGERGLNKVSGTVFHITDAFKKASSGIDSDIRDAFVDGAPIEVLTHETANTLEGYTLRQQAIPFNRLCEIAVSESDGKRVIRATDPQPAQP